MLIKLLLLVAYAGGQPAGCAALRDLGAGICEMKRDVRAGGVPRPRHRPGADGMRPGIPRLVLVTPLAVALAVMLAASRPSAMSGAESPALRSISSRLDGAVSTVLIEATEPVAYLTSQPDPLTVLVDLRNVAAGSLMSRSISDVLAPVGSVRVENATAPDGAPVARVRVNLERVATHRVRSARNTILVEVDRAKAASRANVRSIAPVAY